MTIMNKVLFKILFLCLSFFGVSFSQSVKIVAIVNENIVTSHDLNTRFKLMQLVSPKSIESAPESKAKATILEVMIKEKLFQKAAKENAFAIPEDEVLSTMKHIAAESAALKGKDLQKFLGSDLFESFKTQVEGEMIFGAIFRGRIKDKATFSKDDVARFQSSYNASNEKHITKDEALNILTSMKYREIQENLEKTIQESSVIERRKI